MIVFAVLTSVIALPLVGLFFFRIFENQLVRQTESELIAQSAVLAAVLAGDLRDGPARGLDLGREVPADARPDSSEPYHALAPSLDLASDDLLGPRPAARSAALAPDPAFLEIGARLSAIAAETQKTTLAGFRILDPRGTVIAGREEVGLSLAHVAEVAAALQGRPRSVLRLRLSDRPAPPLYSISRGTRVRVFLALPVVVDGRVAGVVYASRTPSNILKQLYGERRNVILAGLAVLAVALVIGFLFWRTITGPIRELIRRTEAIARGDRAAIRPLSRHGTREIALLSRSFLKMAARLFDRSDYISTFAAHVSHELKSPLTSIQGAAELLRENGASMTEAERERFLSNIIGDTERLTVLVGRLRDLARADNPQTGGSTSLEAVLSAIRPAFPDIAILAEGDVAVDVRLSAENAAIVLSHLIDNARRHKASEVRIEAARDSQDLRVTLGDDGEGISEKNREKVFDPFFTTRRESGGTGLGLGIVQSMLRAHGGAIRLLPSERGAEFEIRAPVA
jgi:signal transduction histidine kinase